MIRCVSFVVCCLLCGVGNSWFVLRVPWGRWLFFVFGCLTVALGCRASLIVLGVCCSVFVVLCVDCRVLFDVWCLLVNDRCVLLFVVC